MSSKSNQYACECAAACGFAIMDPYVAVTLRPDLWASQQNCFLDFSTDVVLQGMKSVRVSLDGLDRSVLVLTRSTNRLAERIEEVTGRRAEILGDYQPAPKPQPAESRIAAENRQRQEEKVAKWRKLAAEEAPAHDCPRRREILEARAELAKLDAEQLTTDV